MEHTMVLGSKLLLICCPMLLNLVGVARNSLRAQSFKQLSGQHLPFLDMRLEDHDHDHASGLGSSMSHLAIDTIIQQLMEV